MHGETMKEIVKVAEAKLKPTRDFLTAYFPARDPWNRYRNVGTMSVKSQISRFLAIAEGVLRAGATPERALERVKELLAEREAECRQYEKGPKA